MLEILVNTTAHLMVFMADNSDHITGKTGRTLDLQQSKKGGAFVAAETSVVERSFGWYYVEARPSATNTKGVLVIHASAVSCDPSDLVIQVVGYDPDDGDRLGLTRIDTSVATRTAQTSIPSNFQNFVFTRVDASVGTRVAQTSVPSNFQDFVFTRVDASVGTRTAQTSIPSNFQDFVFTRVDVSVGTRWSPTEAMTESYAADGAAPTGAQALFGITSFLMEKRAVNSAISSFKLDGTTTAMTFEVNSTVAPTAITRTT